MNTKKIIIDYKGFKKSILSKITFYVFLFGFVGLLVTVVYITNFNAREHFSKQKAGFLYDSEPCYITMEIPYRSDDTFNFWFQEAEKIWGAQYDIYVHNNSKYYIDDYYIEMKVPDEARIDSSWNGNYTLKNGVIRILPAEEADNLSIKKGQTVKYGFILYSNNIVRGADFNIRYHYKIKILTSPVFLFFLSFILVGIVLLIASIVSYIEIKKNEDKLEYKIEAIIRLCASFIDTRDAYTKMHSIHVAQYARMIGERLNMREDELRNVYYAGLMHDVGKVLIPTEILCKEGHLEGSEWEEMKKHTVYGAGVIQNIEEIPNLKDAVLYHHERYDGKGYMSGLFGENIPLVARIICVADAFDAMATNRSYRKHLSKERIIEELKDNSGTQFDSKIASIMVDLIEEGKVSIGE